jgi:hypothetical protein
MNNGKKKGRGPNLGPRALTLRVLAMSLARSVSIFKSSKLDEIQETGSQGALKV